MHELPTISTANYVSSNAASVERPPFRFEASVRQLNRLSSAEAGTPVRKTDSSNLPQEKPVSLRVVKVIIADPNEALPLAQRLLYNGAEQVTDLNDQELFFELDIKSLLDKHNAVRAATLDKKATEKRGSDVFLDPVRIRDLKMVVTTVASF